MTIKHPINPNYTGSKFGLTFADGQAEVENPDPWLLEQLQRYGYLEADADLAPAWVGLSEEEKQAEADRVIREANAEEPAEEPAPRRGPGRPPKGK